MSLSRSRRQIRRPGFIVTGEQESEDGRSLRLFIDHTRRMLRSGESLDSSLGHRLSKLGGPTHFPFVTSRRWGSHANEEGDS